MKFLTTTVQGLAIIALSAAPINAFQLVTKRATTTTTTTSTARCVDRIPSTLSFVSKKSASRICLAAVDDDDDDDDDDGKNNSEETVNPYADPNYPDLEFINYDDPEYNVDQGVTDEFFDTDAEVEKMREDRRRINDEFQFETYHADTLKSGDAYKGEWTVYRTSTFLDGIEDDEVSNIPLFKKERRTRKVVTYGKKIFLDTPAEGFEYRLDGERIVHEERLAESKDFENDEEYEAYVDVNGNFENDQIVGVKRYWPEELSADDFRGEGGIMCCGNCYTIADSIALDGEKKDGFDGPFSELRTEVGIQYKRMRLRVKWDYRVKADDINEATPGLYLYSMIVCRETRERWPRYETMSNVDDSVAETLFGQPGAPGGLYDHPLLGDDEQAKQYMMIDLEGNASVLFPYKINQDPEAFDGNGWVQSLDWSPGRIRFQADRKLLGGEKVRGLKTLELSEVEAENADQWRPNDGGDNMRQ